MIAVLKRKDFKVGEKTTFDICWINEPEHRSSPYPDNILAEVEHAPISPSNAQINGVSKYEVDVEIIDLATDESQKNYLQFKAVSEVREKKNIESTPEYLEADKHKKAIERQKRYEFETDQTKEKVIEILAKEYADKHPEIAEWLKAKQQIRDEVK